MLLFQDLTNSPLLILVICLGGFTIIFLASVRYRPGLRQIPGPFWASFLPIDRLVTAARANQHQVHIKYHRRYGPLVRLGPRHVSFSNPELIHEIYTVHSRFWKSEFYPMWDVKTPKGNISTTFSETDEDVHRTMRRPLGAAFALSSILDYEHLADRATATFQRKLDNLQGTVVDLGQWLHWYAFDVISSITFSSELGFMENEKDIEGMIKAIEGRQVYSAIVGEFPILHNFLLGNRFIALILNSIPSVERINTARYIVEFTARQLEHRKLNGREKGMADLVSRFKREKDGVPTMSDAQLLGHAAGNVHAGSDTTAITLRTLIYYVCKTPRIYNRLTSEVRSADAKGALSKFVTYHEASHLPYFQACLKEALRMHPAVGFLLERVVPAGGAQISGIHLPAGTIIGANPWVIAHNGDIYGDQVDEFRPERWLEADDTKLRLMEKSAIAFGAGSRVCIGKHIALMEISKLVPQLFRNYDIELSDPNVELKVINYWFVRQEGLRCVVKRRQ